MFAHAATFGILQARAGEYASVLRGNMTSTLLDAGLLFLLRFALDDSVEGVMSAAVHALRALLVSPEDEVWKYREAWTPLRRVAHHESLKPFF